MTTTPEADLLQMTSTRCSISPHPLHLKNSSNRPALQQTALRSPPAKLLPPRLSEVALVSSLICGGRKPLRLLFARFTDVRLLSGCHTEVSNGSSPSSESPDRSLVI